MPPSILARTSPRCSHHRPKYRRNRPKIQVPRVTSERGIQGPVTLNPLARSIATTLSRPTRWPTPTVTKWVLSDASIALSRGTHFLLRATSNRHRNAGTSVKAVVDELCQHVRFARRPRRQQFVGQLRLFEDAAHDGAQIGELGLAIESCEIRKLLFDRFEIGELRRPARAPLVRSPDRRRNSAKTRL